MNDYEIAYELTARQVQIIQEASDEFKNLKIEVSEDRQFAYRGKQIPKDTILLILHYLAGTVNLGQHILPVSITAMSEQGTSAKCRDFLFAYANAFNLQNTTIGGTYLTQVYSTPSQEDAFAEVQSGYRATYEMGLTLLMSANALRFSVYYQGKEVPILTSDFDFAIQHDAQATFSSEDFTKSKPTLGTLTISFTGFLTNDGLAYDMLSSLCAREKKPYALTLRFVSGLEISSNFYIYSFSSANNIGEMPSYAVVLSE